MENKRASGGFVGTAVGVVMTVIQSTHPDWFGDHPWIFPVSLLILFAGVLFWITQYPWFQKVLGIGIPRKEAGGLPPSPAPKPSKLRIHNADYRAIDGRGTPFDVTECLQKMICGDSLVLNITNDGFRVNGHNYVPKDPFFGVVKRLDVTYSFDGVTGRAIRPEGSRIVLPEDTFLATALADLPLIPFSRLQLEAFCLAKEMRVFLRDFEPQPPPIDARTQDEQTRIQLMDERTNWRTKIWSAYELQFADRQRKLILEFGAQGHRVDLAQYARDKHEPATVITRQADAITALAHRLDGARLTVEP